MKLPINPSHLGSAALAIAAAMAIAAPTPASATACTSYTASTGQSCTTVDPGDGAGVEIDNAALTFLAVLGTENQSNSTIASEVNTFLTADGFTGVVYLGRAGDAGSGPSGTSVSTVGDTSGTWTFTPGSTGDVGQFIAMHAGEGQTDVLFQIVAPGTSGIWDTSENDSHGLSNFDLFGGSGTTPRVPEPASLAIFGTALAGLGLIRRRRQNRV